ncbi:MAG: iron hydrogenase small subunit [Spirochaetales bacterium]|nr:iron hydrogenase small subunit [Spirochaetales bacterium]
MQDKVHITINSKEFDVDKDLTILDAARINGINIPTLCHHADLGIAGNCRMCLVDISGSHLLQPACATVVTEGVEIQTNTRRVRQTRKELISLLMSEHDTNCLRCPKNGNCELQDLAAEYGVDGNDYIQLSADYTIDISSPAIIKDDSKCIRCQRCVRTCEELQGVNALAVVNKGGELRISTFLDKPLHYVVCTNCGQCVNRCPTGALTEKNYVADVWNAIDDPSKHVVVQTAPAVRIALGESLGYPAGERVTGKMVSALRGLGFDKVFDTNFTADLTIMEEGTELLMRLKHALTGEGKSHGALPQFSSCSPGWIKYLEHEYPDLLNHLSTCKSPQQMFGTLAKTYYADIAGIDPADITVVSIMPCTAKKFEAQRPEMTDSGFRDVDYVLTTRELGHMIKEAGIDFDSLEDSSCDSLLGAHTGAAVLFGATGGVMEAALRTAWEIVTGREIPFTNLDVTPVRGMAGVKSAAIKIENALPAWSFLEGVELKVAVAHGLANVKTVLQLMKKGEADYHFIEFMACPGGCLGGGGQPIRTTPEIRQSRMDAVYAEDNALPIRKSHLNPEVLHIYKDFLGEPCGEKSHHLLHTSYTARGKY